MNGLLASLILLSSTRWYWSRINYRRMFRTFLQLMILDLGMMKMIVTRCKVLMILMFIMIIYGRDQVIKSKSRERQRRLGKDQIKLV